MKIFSRDAIRTIIEAAWSTGGPMFAMHAHLVTAFATTPGDRMSFADVTEATYSGYASKPVVPPASEFDTIDGAEGTAGMLIFTPTDGVTPNVIVGVVYTDNATAGNVVGIDVFDNPVALPDQFTSLALVPIIDQPWHVNGKPSVVIS